ncbi:MAG: nuclear transport factor 2 family protein [Chitinophagaceae bacterium]|jgi:hypothetical protein|nr:nuclear transport factor 2 family protein [Chitinophagaceae bacterium]
MKKICFLFAIFLVQVSFAQTNEDSVKATINSLFLGMKTSNPTLLKACFADSAIMQTIVKNKEGKIVVKTDQLNAFVQQIASLPPNAADEQITFETIKIDGVLATVWTPYSFYYNGKFSHCGVNHFVLLKVNNEWKIQYLIDTRRREGCK